MFVCALDRWSLRPRFPLAGVLGVGARDEIWWKRALSAVIALVVPDFALLALGRLDLAVYTSAGAMCALYAHALPYRARARMTAWIGLVMTGTVAAAITAASLTGSAVLLVAVGALLAAGHRLFTESLRAGPPGNVVLTFIGAACAFVPHRLGEVPKHVALTALGAAFAWAVVMAPALLRPHGPERRAVAQALEAAAAIDGPAGRRRAAAAVNAAWRAVLAARPSGLERLIVQAEEALVRTPDPVPLRRWARALRETDTVPDVGLSGEQHEELVGLAAERSAARPVKILPGLVPVVLRTLLATLLAGWVSLLAGVGHPYWALVTAAAVCQANAVLSWTRGLQRALGNFAGLAVFTLLLPVSRTGAVALILLILACQVAAEAFIPRNYWLGTVFVTPMALLMTEFAAAEPGFVLVTDRWLDTCVGVAAGLLACLLVVDRRAAHRVDLALERLERTRESSRTVAPVPAATALASALAELRDSLETESGEWWRRGLPEERIVQAERDGHRELARLKSLP
ncbi:FUSC family protein [Actinocorallia populi]|uniref:FUSC family protein n=1 Tax=Actinocorallia populi TaxID=2079200 RepID=UPI000D090367|nr:FUSC family protein [Actinocorallia populi]